MAYRFLNWGNGGDIKQNIWELNPQLPFIPPFSKLYKMDKSKGKEASSNDMWCISYMQDPRYDNKFFRMPEQDKMSALTYMHPDFNVELPIIQECLEAYDIHCLTPAAKAFKEEEASLVKRAEFIKSSPYTFDEIAKNSKGEPMYTRLGTPIMIKGTAKDLDSMRANTLKIYKQYEEVKKIFEEEQGNLRVHGGREQTIREKGQLLEFDDND